MRRRDICSFILAGLDGWIVIRFGFRSITQSCQHLWHASRWPLAVNAIEAARLALVISLAASAWLLPRRQGWVALGNLAQLPLRIAFALLGESEYLSFGFLGGLAAMLPPTLYSQLGLLGAAALLELLRTALQLILALRRSRSTPPMARAVKEARAR
jgi:hypothetical protein